MRLSVVREAARLRDMTVPELRERYQEVFGEECRSRHKDFIRKRILWRLQANGDGSLSERARRRAEELAADSDVRLTAPPKTAPATGPTKVAAIHISHDNRLPMPGTVITREYKGETITVHVLPDGFEYGGEVYRTLSAVAKAVTGTHWNGYHFFKLGRKGAKRDE